MEAEHRLIQERYKNHKSTPVEYNAWKHSDRPRSFQWMMRGIKGCETCSGNGYVWVDRFSCWSRCWSCGTKLMSLAEARRKG